MTQLPQQVQTELVRGYQQQAVLYDQALELVRCMELAFRDDHDMDQPLARLAELLQAIDTVDRDMTQWKQRWHQEGGPMSGPLESVMHRVRSQVSALLGMVQRLEQSADEARRRLVPQLEDQVRRRRMQSAYTAALHRPRVGGGND